MGPEDYAFDALKVTITCNEQLGTDAMSTISKSEDITEMKEAFTDFKTWEKYKIMLGTITTATKNSFNAGKLAGMNTK